MSSMLNVPVDKDATIGILPQMLIAGYVVATVLFNRDGGFLLHVPKLLGLLIIVLFFLSVLGNRRTIYIPMTYRILGVWFFFAIVSTLLADEVRLGRIISVAQLAVIGFLITNFLIWNRGTRFYVFTLVAAVTLSSIWLHLQPDAFMEVGGRTRGTIGNANAHGVLLSVGFVLAAVLALSTPRWLPKLMLAGLSTWFFVQLLQTGSRQAILGGVVIGGGVVLGAHLYRAWHASVGSFTKSVLLVGAVLALMFTAIISSDYWFRMQRAKASLGEEPGADGSVTDRLWMVQRGLELWAEHPIFGIGIDNFRHSQQADHLFATHIGTYAHNNYIELLVGTGLIGFGLYISIYLLWLAKLGATFPVLRDGRFFSSYVPVAAIVFLVIATDFTRVSYFEKLFWLLLPWIVAELHLLQNSRAAVLTNLVGRRYAGRSEGPSWEASEISRTASNRDRITKTTPK